MSRHSVLVLASFYSSVDEELQWDKVNDAIKQIDPDDLFGALDEIGGFPYDEVEKNQAEVQAIFDDLKSVFEESNSPYLVRVYFPGIIAYIAGGDVPDHSGDDPSGAYSTMVQAMAFPEILAAVGLDYA